MNQGPTEVLRDVLGGGLSAAVLEFRRGGFHLGRDLDDLRTLQRDERTPAVLFHCGRILEALLSAASELYFGDATTSVEPNLRRLAELGVVRGARLDQLQVLHQLALDASGTRRPIHWADASVGLLLLERLLTWFFVELPRGARLPLLGGRGPAATPRDLELMEALDSLESREPGWVDLPRNRQGAFLRTPCLPALYIARALRESQPPPSELYALTEDALRSFPDDIRLGQLLARLLLLRNNVGAAIARLEALDRRYPNEPDTLRVLADAYARAWQTSPSEHRDPLLRKALQTYQNAWNRSYETDHEAGMQAALLGLFRGRTQRAELVAQTVFDSYQRRFLALGRDFRFLGFSDRVRLAHAALILRETEYARRRYHAAFSAPDATAAAIAEAKRQIKVTLLALELPSNPKRFLDGKSGRRRRVNAQQLMLPMMDGTVSRAAP